MKVGSLGSWVVLPMLGFVLGSAGCNDSSGEGLATTGGGSGGPATSMNETAAAGKSAPAAGSAGSSAADGGSKASSGSAGSKPAPAEAGHAGSAADGGSGGSAPSENVAGDEAGAGGAAGSDAPSESKPPFEATGMPLMAPENTWTWIEFDDTTCRAGGKAGISVNLNSASKNVAIYLEGGGACFDAQTCGSNPDSVGQQMPGNAGIFARSRDENPIKDWNMIYVPYCTGDVHTGTKDDGQVEGVTGTQHFMGRSNLKSFLNRIVPTFKDAEQVLLTGASAGGFGAASNGVFVQWAFGDIPVTVIDDSGPTFSEMYLPKCLSQTYLKTWGLDGSVLDDCDGMCDASMDYSLQFLEYSGAHSAGHFNGLIESDQDSIIRGFFGIGTNNGANDCKGTLLVTSMSADDFLMGLLDYRERVKQYPGFSTFYPSSTQHTWIASDSFYTATAGDVKMVDWFAGILQGKPAVHAGH
jgi:hypothetical protein